MEEGEEREMAFWKRDKSSSSSGAVMVRRRGGRMEGPKKKRIGRERRRVRVGMSGDEGYERIGIIWESVKFFSGLGSK